MPVGDRPDANRRVSQRSGANLRVMAVPSAPAGTHDVGDDAVLGFPNDPQGTWLMTRRGHRAIGVVYDPSAERRAH
jgi:erythromycin esterase